MYNESEHNTISLPWEGKANKPSVEGLITINIQSWKTSKLQKGAFFNQFNVNIH